MESYLVSNVIFAAIGACLFVACLAGIAGRFVGPAYKLSWVGLGGSVVVAIVAIAFAGRDRLVDNDLIVPCLVAAVLFAALGVAIRARRVANSPA